MNADGFVEYICIQVSGKLDNNIPVYLTLWPNRKNKLLCPITMLLWWLALTGITEGYLFPPEELLKTIILTSKATSEFNISYNTFLDVVQKTLSTHWDHMKWGTHTLRKTAFVLATWGGGGDIDIMKAARLKSLETVAMYRRDARTLRDMALARGWKFEHLVDDYRGQILLDLTLPQPQPGVIQPGGTQLAPIAQADEVVEEAPAEIQVLPIPHIPVCHTWKDVVRQWNEGDLEKGIAIPLRAWNKDWRKPEKQKYHVRKHIGEEFGKYNRNVLLFENAYAGHLDTSTSLRQEIGVRRKRQRTESQNE